MRNHTIDNRLLKTGHYAGLKFEQGWLFVHVLETEYIELKPWILLNENNERGEIAGETAGSRDDEIVDEVERELIEPSDSEQNIFFQLFTGVSPSRVQIFPQFGRDETPNLRGGSEPGKPQVYLNGYDSPYNNPTEQSEIVTVNNIDNLSLQAYNPTSEPEEARVSFHVNKFKYAVVDDVGLMKAFIQGQKPFKDHSMGLGVQDKDQARAPGWMDTRFGDVMLSTREILEHEEDDGSSGGSSVGDNIPQPGNGGSN